MHGRRFLENEPANFPDGNECMHIWTQLPQWREGGKRKKKSKTMYFGGT